MQEQKLQELQLLEQNLQNLLLQKQAFQMEFSETQSALKEIESSGEEVYKILGQLMIKTSKIKMKEELANKSKFLDARINSIEKQETLFTKKIEDIREELMKSINK
jgi:prefoldin beta subunit